MVEPSGLGRGSERLGEIFRDNFREFFFALFLFNTCVEAIWSLVEIVNCLIFANYLRNTGMCCACGREI